MGKRVGSGEVARDMGRAWASLYTNLDRLFSIRFFYDFLSKHKLNSFMLLSEKALCLARFWARGCSERCLANKSSLEGAKELALVFRRGLASVLARQNLSAPVICCFYFCFFLSSHRIARGKKKMKKWKQKKMSRNAGYSLSGVPVRVRLEHFRLASRCFEKLFKGGAVPTEVGNAYACAVQRPSVAFGEDDPPIGD